MGTELLAAGTAKIRVGMDGVPGDPEQPGLLKAAARRADGNARVAEGTETLYSSAAAVSPSNLIKADVAVALGLVALGSVGAFLALRNRRLAQDRRLAQETA